jgi:chromodomain-helicase-DNA-binding protein 3/chromodomain-helicase-DNA-binding protein 4
VLENAEMRSLVKLSNEESTDLVVYGFSILHRLEFMDFVLHFGLEFDGVDAFLTALTKEKPNAFKAEIKP